MKKIISFILATLMILFAFASCNNSASKETEEQTETQTENSTEKQTETEKVTENSDKNNSDNNENGNSDNNNIDDSGNIEDWNKGTYTRNGNKITFGYYPQTNVADTKLTAALTSKAGTLPTSENSQAWTPYGYYIGGKVENFMWYIDVFNGGEKYRGVYFTTYRSYWPQYELPGETSTYQYKNGYIVSTVYWFKYEPVTWTILNENTSDGSALILCDMIIDSQAYQDDYYIDGNEYYDMYNTSTGVPSGTYANNYAYSTIRKWLNENFYNTAFSELQKQIILTTTVDNSATSEYITSNEYACENTQDKIFLLSSKEVTNAAYGFENELSNHISRQRKATDYAQAQGAKICTERAYMGNASWWLRQPTNFCANRTYLISYKALITADTDIYCNYVGVVPALQIKL